MPLDAQLDQPDASVMALWIIHFGEKLHDTRLGWIQPYLVNKAEAFGTVPAKA